MYPFKIKPIMRKLVLFTLIFGLSYIGKSQELNPYLEKGDLSLGLRTTTSLFGHDEVPGLGTGGEFRLQLFK